MSISKEDKHVALVCMGMAADAARADIRAHEARGEQDSAEHARTRWARIQDAIRSFSDDLCPPV
jgi:hypothetical protein